MLLNTLEIKGFKSFGDKVVLNFDAGITGIVGPNGCGKSNVVDAIRWVLGEQKTRALRSEKMENIIFNGTKNRKPLQLAEVSLTFSNNKGILPTEFSQVCITRRYYRTGESEYLLNGIPCRLKDITGLFLDTGIGSDTYAIIELKMVDDLLNDREGSRRTMFEEAAGISKFKLRKKETHKKLEETSKDLERVDDLLHEITRNLKQLEKQAKQAQQYFQFKEEYKQSSLILACFSLSAQYRTQQQLTADINALTDANTALLAQISNQEASIESDKAAHAQIQALVSSRHKTLNEHTQLIRDYESQKQLKNERLKSLTDKARSQLASIEQDRKFLHTNTLKTAEVSHLISTFSEEKANFNLHATHTLEDLTKAQKLVSELQSASNEANKEVRTSQQALHELEKNAEIANVQLSRLREEVEKNESESSHQSRNLDVYAVQLDELQVKLNSKIDELEAWSKQELELDVQIEAAVLKNDKLREEINKLNRQIDAKQNEFNLTKSMLDNLEGYPEAIRFLRKNIEWKVNAPLLSDILTTEENYRIALEHYLEPYLNYYVVNAASEALQAISLLGKAAKGRANFFVLNQVPELKVANMPEYEGAVPALKMVEYHEDYGNLLGSLLKDVYISTGPTLPDVGSATVISANGTLNKTSISYSGGSVGIFEGKKLGRALNLEKMQNLINKYSKEASELKNTQNATLQLIATLKGQTKKKDMERLQKEIIQLQQEHVSIKVKREQIAQLLQSVSTRKEDLIARINELDAGLQIGSPELMAAKQKLKLAEEQVSSLSSQVFNAIAAQNEANAAHNEANNVLTKKTSELGTQQQELTYRQNERLGLEKRLQKTLQEQQATQSDIDELTQKETIDDDTLMALIAERDAIALGVTEAEQQYYAMRTAIDGNEKEVKEIQRKRELHNSQLNELQLKLHESRLSIASIAERLRVEHETDVDDELMDAFKPEQYDEKTIAQSAQSTKNKLEKIGPINPMAMEAYAEIETRFTFISSQKNDLEQARKSLLSTISEIDDVASTTFLETFQAIRENFQKVFRTLFSEEDTCELLLTNPENPLESQIEITAKPKGKRPLSINQLSGGEKTLTAISLLFAIYLIKPAPFCIFDEVDAPLDDANIDKFNNIIREFSKQSQFIIVTHNKRTMISTDVIYGITMLEAGVSRAIPVDLRELE